MQILKRTFFMDRLAWTPFGLAPKPPSSLSPWPNSPFASLHFRTALHYLVFCLAIVMVIQALLFGLGVHTEAAPSLLPLIPVAIWLYAKTCWLARRLRDQRKSAWSALLLPFGLIAPAALLLAIAPVELALAIGLAALSFLIVSIPILAWQATVVTWGHSANTQA